jgi:tetratricopeptide (TPR) repeat protein
MKKIFILFMLSSISCVSGALLFSQSAERADALKLYQSGSYTQAIAVCEQELVDNPRNLDSYAVLCWSLVRNRQYAEAEQRATSARTLSWYDHRIVEVLAEAKYFLGKNNESLALFQEYITLIPDVAVSRTRIDAAYYYMGELYIRQARYEHADIALTQAVHIEPNIDLWWVRLGYAREMAQNFVPAIEAYDKALALNASSQDALRGKERSLSRINR